MDAIWHTPKTNWRPEDPFRLVPDYQRIRENILFLAESCRRVLGRAPAMDEPRPAAVEDIPTPEFFNRVEQSAAAIGRCLPRGAGPYPVYQAGDPVWDAKELNRLEGQLLLQRADLAAIRAAQPTLAFCLCEQFTLDSVLGGDAL